LEPAQLKAAFWLSFGLPTTNLGMSVASEHVISANERTMVCELDREA